MNTLYEELNKIWFNKPKPVEVKKLSIQDILSKRKALTLSARINGHETVITPALLSAHTEPGKRWSRGRSKRNGKINRTADLLYKEVQIKNFFPKMTKEELKKILWDFTNQNLKKNKKHEERIDLLKVRRYQRLLPLSVEKYEEIGNKSDKWGKVIRAIKSLSIDGYVIKYIEAFSPALHEHLWRIDEKPYHKPTEKEMKYA